MKILTGTLCAFLLCGCITREYKSGIPIRQSQITQIKNATSKKDIYEILGSPASINFVGNEKWFYYTAEGDIFAFLDPMFSKYEILSIQFNANDEIEKIKLTNISNKKIQINEDKKTQLPSAIELNFFQELFGNIGKFNSSGVPTSN